MIIDAYKLDRCNNNVKTLVRAGENEFGTICVNSGHRTQQYNKEVGASNSEHCKGNAVDISVPSCHVYKIAGWLLFNIRKYPWSRMAVNIFQNYIHVDFKDIKVRPYITQYDKNNHWM